MLASTPLPSFSPVQPFASTLLPPTLSVLAPALVYSIVAVRFSLLASALVVYSVLAVRLSLLASALVVYSVSAVRLSLLASALSLLPLWWSTSF